MAKLPDQFALGSVGNLRSGRAVAQVDMSPLAKGIAAVGRGVSVVADDQQQRQEYETGTRFDEFQSQQKGLAKDAIANAEPGAVGITDQFGKTYDDNAQKFLETVPKPLREKYQGALSSYGLKIREGVGDFQMREKSRFAGDQLDQTINRTINEAMADPSTLKEAREKSEAFIQLNPDLTPIEKQERLAKLPDMFATSIGQASLRDKDAVNRAVGGTVQLPAFEAALVGRESSGNPSVVNSLGYAGLYQFGAPRLADLGVYTPGTGESLKGWSKTSKGAEGKWSGTFNIPGFESVKTFKDFLGNPDAQRAAYGVHQAKFDKEIASNGLDKYEGKTVGGVPITREGLYAMMHLGGVGGAKNALESGGSNAASDAYGTSVLEYARLGASAAGKGPEAFTVKEPAVAPSEQRYGNAVKYYQDQFPDASPDVIGRLAVAADDQYQKQTREEVASLRAELEIASQNAPAAIQSTGAYSGAMPTPEQFVRAYGEDGAQKFNQFMGEVQTSQEMHRFQTASGAEIQQSLEAAKPVSSGDNAAFENKRYEVLERAAAQTLKAREADPSSYTRQAFSQVDDAWTAAQESGNYQEALAVTAAAQQQLGIKNMQLLPKEVAKSSVDKFNDAELPQQERIGAATGLIFSTNDPVQQRAIFSQMVKEGLPDATEGAIRAYARGDEGAGRRLMQAAIIDPAKLPGKASSTPSQISETIQSQLMDNGQIGDIYYGLSDGTTENQERAIRDSKLLTNAVNLRIRNGETLANAVTGSAKDLYGDVKPNTGDGRFGAQLLIPADQDPKPILDGLNGLLPTVRSELEAPLKSVSEKAPTATGERAVLNGVFQNNVNNVLAQGYFRNGESGYVFVNPFTGSAVRGKNGGPLSFTEEEVLKSGQSYTPIDDPKTMIWQFVQ